jgi:hypothetical protein
MLGRREAGTKLSLGETLKTGRCCGVPLLERSSPAPA